MAELVFFTALGRTATRSQLAPLVVRAGDDLPGAERFAAWFRCRVELGAPRPSLLFADDVIERPFLTANAAAWTYFEPGLRPVLLGGDPDATTSARVRAALVEALPGSRPSIDTVCRKLSLSRRTLQRRLREESKTFQGVLDSTRLELANWYLQSSRLSQGEIAYLLGFEEANSFARAYAAWTGTTPDRHRRAHG
jgi:AraC-like DNA-binding protein